MLRSLQVFLDKPARPSYSTNHAVLHFRRPTGGVAAALLFFFLNLNPHRGRTLKEHVQDFDFIGLALMIAGVICLLLGFNSSETDCKPPPVVRNLLTSTIAKGNRPKPYPF